MKILYLPPIAYGNLKQRPQYLAEELAKRHEVLYIDPTVSLMKFLLKGGERPFGYQYQAKEHLQIKRLNGMFSAHRSLEAVWGGLCLPERLQLRKYLWQADAVWIGYVPWYRLVRGFRGIVIYDKMDEDAQITQNALLRKLIVQTEPDLIQRANHIFVTAQQFYEEISKVGKHPVLLSNAVDVSQSFAKKSPAAEKREGNRIFGYVGMISHWFDINAILTILDEDPRNQVILVGPTEIPPIRHERLRYVGRVPKEEVVNWIDMFDVCLYPFQFTPLLNTIDPVKLYEYLARNKPVLAARSRETEKFQNLITDYGDMKELREVLRRDQFKKPFLTENERQSFIAENSWQSRGQVLIQEIEQRV